ncbi:hypothetical protein FZI85_08550 [Mycobacterium sp. CBMA293]|uniref:hypothetical protein n=1 Tax=unclassified Mycolicibacterium TaxID=2636767 RepID=UPI0012DEC036|nr:MULTISPECIES: hypothetical protein [unclassified Mycolicibacterium]MUL46355.1 hypothetical protein [Mycolicibacterium sp. CBMA 360]MUL57133.1 hypothetical protein [Mycolicibacterium sp. CBMA 335]MUL70173.1 hypothetical protein [Mycolicibacterium sp. CBMA 311]MUL92221.1 hypothetical protein [Mycolicibacterium sp. CBMA 230]MUM04845.1 hypothetical protein [Mycolicibacterium sp. CBMA 213]
MIELPDDTARTGAARIADLWFPGSARSPRLTALPGYEALLSRALQANPELSEAFIGVAELAAGADELSAEVVAEWPAELVEAAFYFLSCTYYMAPEARRAVGYPGQIRTPSAQATPDQMLDDDLLAPVLALGPTYIPTPATD